jgi:hypothetical protein
MSTKEVFYTVMNGGFKGFIDRIACDWEEGSNPPATRSILILEIDGVTREFNYAIDINKPYVFDPPIVVRNYFKWRITNNDVPYIAADGTRKTGAHYYGILTDGCLARPKT